MLFFYLNLLETDEQKKKFTDIYEQYQGFMLHAALSIVKDQGLAEDAVQESFLRIIKIIDDIRIDNIKALNSFLWNLTQAKAVDILRKRRHESSIEDEQLFKTLDNKSINKSDFAVDITNLDFLLSEIEKLSVIYRVPLIFRSHGYTIKEIANALDITEDTVKVRIYRGKKLLTEALNEHCEAQK